MTTRNAFQLIVLLMVAVISSCASKGEPQVSNLGNRYKHSFEFMWNQVGAEIMERWTIDLEGTDKKNGVILTAWDVNLHPQSMRGRRRRLTITIEGDVGKGYEVTAMAEEEVNTEQVNPLSEVEADWDPTVATEGIADRFLIALYRRLNPRRSWELDKER